MLFTIPALFERTVRAHPDKTAIAEGERKITFAALHEQAIQTAHALKDLGVNRGDRVGICMSKSIDQVLAILGAVYCNAVFVPILPKLKQANIEHVIKDSGMTLLITDSARAGEIEPCARLTRIVIGRGGSKPGLAVLSDLSDKVARPKSFFRCIGPDDAAIIYSSGSTGRPKGIRISHRNLHDGARIVAEYLKTQADDKICAILSFNFDYGLNQLWQTLYLGCTLYLHELVFPNDTLKFISDNGLTVLPLMPVIITKLFDERLYRPNARNDYSRLKYVCSSGGRVSDRMRRMIRETFPSAKFYSMFGLTEAFRSTYLPPQELEKRPQSIGKAIPDVEILVLDDNGNSCAPGVAGELVHRGGCITKGYWNAPEATSKVFRERPGYPGEICVYSGDLVKTDEDGFLYYIGRKDAMIKTYGFRVSPTEIEEIASRHAKVNEAVAFGVRNDEVGEDIVLYYTTVDCQPIDQELRAYLKETLPEHMVPKYLVHAASFPSTGNEGKIDRVTVKSAYLLQQERTADTARSAS